MTRKTLISRPAPSAIAAVLALVATPAMAQVAAPTADTSATEPTLSAAPVILPDAQPTPASPAPMSQAIPVPGVTPPQITIAPPPASTTTPAPVVAPILPEVTPAPAETTASARTNAPERTVERTSAPTPSTRQAAAAPAPRTAQPADASAAPAAYPAPEAETVTPVLSPSDLMAMNERSEAVANEPAPTQTVTTGNDQTMVWAIGAGGAVLLLGAGALAFMRRRDRADDAREEAAFPRRVSTDRPATPAVARTAPVASVPVEPAVARDKVAEPVAVPVTAATAATTTPAWSPAMASAPSSERFAALEAAAAEAPSAENPFMTRRKRMRRAEFMQRTGQTPPPLATPVAPSATPAAAAPATAPARESAPQKQPVYNFGSSVSYRPKGWKPATT